MIRRECVLVKSRCKQATGQQRNMTHPVASEKAGAVILLGVVVVLCHWEATAVAESAEAHILGIFAAASWLDPSSIPR
jgi:hypothetical protein